MLKAGALGIGGLGAFSFVSAALGLTDAHQLELAATWVSLVAAVACIGRSVIHVGWGGYLTRHPDGPRDRRRALGELNLLVATNVILCAFWIWLAVGQLGRSAPQPPLPFAFLVPCAIILVAMETLRCARVTGKRRGTEIVCEGPIGGWFREFSDTSAKGTGPVHKVMVFLRHPGNPKVVSRFLCLLAAAMFIPWPVHSSAAAGSHVDAAILAGRGSQGPGAETGPVGAGGPEEEGPEEGEAEPAACGPYDGRPAPGTEREQIVALFEEAGTGQAGCPGRAEEVPGQAWVWMAPAHCGDELRSLATTGPGYLPALLYQQAASFARARGQEGTLLGASDRHPVRGGDFYVIDTTLGSFVLIRRRPSTGRTGAGQGSPGSCEPASEGNFPYTVVPPGLIDLWIEAVEEDEWLFPVSAASGTDGGDFEFLREYPAAESHAHATCTGALDCTLRIGDMLRHGSGTPTYVSVAEIVSLADSAP